jgi:flagellar hook-associated protein 2
MALSSPGIGSGLDVNNIVTQLMNVEQQPLTLLDQKEASYQAQLSAYGNLRGALAGFQSAVSGLDSLAKFEAVTATPANASVLSASAGANAPVGTHSLNVTQLAQAQSLVAAGQSSLTAAIGSGASTVLTFDFGTISGGALASGVYTGASFVQDGTQPSGSVSIDSSNNSLQGIRDAINGAQIGVTASIVNDGSGTPYRLALSSASSGASHSLRISVNGDAALQSLLSYDASGTQNLTQTAAAADANLTVDGVSVSSASNTVSGAIDGVTLTLAATGSTSVTVAGDVSGAKSAIQAFVKSYNDFDKTLTDLTKFDTTGAGQSGPLIGDAAARTVQSRLRDALSNVLPGLASSSLPVLGSAGIAFQRDGTLAIDDGKLNAALGNADDLAALFTSVGRTSDSLVSFKKAGQDTQPGTYSISVTSLATQGKLVASAPAGTTITAGVNDQLAITVDGLAATVKLAAGTYTPASLAAQVQAAVNGASELSSHGSGVLVTESGGALTITSKRYGSASMVSAGGTAANALLGSAPVSTAGANVAGSINGSAATGSGQTLTSADGLSVEIPGGSLGSRGTVSFTRGYAQALNGVLDDMLSNTGLLAGRSDGINRSIKDIDQQRDALNQRLSGIEQRYRAQFTALDTLLSNMQSTSAFLTQQLARLP